MTIKAILSRGEAMNVCINLISDSASFLQAEKVALTVLRCCAKWKTFDWFRVKAFVDAQYSKQLRADRKRFQRPLPDKGDVGNEHF